jgi:hypothetical protein
MSFAKAFGVCFQNSIKNFPRLMFFHLPSVRVMCTLTISEILNGGARVPEIPERKISSSSQETKRRELPMTRTCCIQINC